MLGILIIILGHWALLALDQILPLHLVYYLTVNFELTKKSCAHVSNVMGCAQVKCHGMPMSYILRIVVVCKCGAGNLNGLSGSKRSGPFISVHGAPCFLICQQSRYLLITCSFSIVAI